MTTPPKPGDLARGLLNEATDAAELAERICLTDLTGSLRAARAHACIILALEHLRFAAAELGASPDDD